VLLGSLGALRGGYKVPEVLRERVGYRRRTQKICEGRRRYALLLYS
jgi:hypothetical protein